MFERPTYPTLVINTVGEPGSGKTTLSFWLSQALKKEGIVTEFVPEVVKYECFDAAGRSRVSSGKFDHRYLLRQTRLLRPLIGNVEVVVNDGAYEIFYFYARRRMDERSLENFQNRLMALRESVIGSSESWFVMPTRNHPYELVGRNEDEHQARAIRVEMMDCLAEKFGKTATTLLSDEDRESFLQKILDRVRLSRFNQFSGIPSSGSLVE